MKKFVSFFLAVLLMLSLSVTAFADGNNNNVNGRDIYDLDSDWWIDWYGSNSWEVYEFNDDELGELRIACAEAMCKAEGLMALTSLITKLQERGMRLRSYTVVVEKTGNHVYFIEVQNSRGYVRSCYFATFTHDGVNGVISNLKKWKTSKYYSIFLTTYVSGQKIKNYAESEKITGFDLKTDDAIDQFISIIEYYEPTYDDGYTPGWDPEWDDSNG